MSASLTRASGSEAGGGERQLVGAGEGDAAVAAAGFVRAAQLIQKDHLDAGAELIGGAGCGHVAQFGQAADRIHGGVLVESLDDTEQLFVLHQGVSAVHRREGGAGVDADDRLIAVNRPPVGVIDATTGDGEIGLGDAQISRAGSNPSRTVSSLCQALWLCMKTPELY